MHFLSQALPRLGAALLASLCLPMCLTTPGPETPTTAAQKLFTQEVKPILEKNCLTCHNGANPALLDLSNHAAPFLPHPTGKAYIVPGKPDQSLLIESISREGLHQRAMPRLVVTLTDMEIGTLREWISLGAPWPTGQAGKLKAQANPEQPSN